MKFMKHSNCIIYYSGQAQGLSQAQEEKKKKKFKLQSR